MDEFSRAKRSPHRCGPYDQPPIPDIEDETSPPSAEENTENKEPVGENELIDGEK